jgi:flagellar biosynthesis protein FlhB
MSDDAAQERTEEPTSKRRHEAKEKGQIPRSRELTTAVVMIVGAVGIIALKGYFSNELLNIFSQSFVIERESLFDDDFLAKAFVSMLSETFFILLPLFFIVLVAALAGSAMLGGMLVNFSNVQIKLEKLDPIQGLKRIFSWRGLIELIKALAKFLLIAVCTFFLIKLKFAEILGLTNEPALPAIVHSFGMLAWALLLLSCSLLLIALVDVPFQLWQHSQQLKMTYQEIKDEAKDTDGNPEIKSKIRRLQQERARGRMMAEVPKADVVITNPTHYAVALAYAPSKKGAPMVIAKGLDLIALQIQKVARANGVVVLEQPPLARAIYHSTDLDQEIPAGLYIAVAQVLAYVYQIRKGKSKKSASMKALNDLPIPDNFKF